jgi:hypothetical protein
MRKEMKRKDLNNKETNHPPKKRRTCGKNMKTLKRR